MSKITQYSRISHHTIAGSSSATFSVPTSEDFTDGTWTAFDLALSEIGVNEDSKKVYIRINDEVKEFQFTGATGGSQDLATTLSVGNTTGANDIIFDLGQKIMTSDTGYIELGKSPGSTNSISISNGNDGITTPIANLSISGDYPYITAQATDILTTVKDVLAIDPQGLGNGTGIKSENTSTTNYTITNHTPDTIVLSAIDNGSVITDTISIDPQVFGNGTGMQSTDSTNLSYVNITPTLVDLGTTDYATYQSTLSLLNSLGSSSATLQNFDLSTNDNATIILTTTQSSIIVDAGSGPDKTEIISTENTILLKSPGDTTLPSAVYNKVKLDNASVTITTNSLDTNKSGYYITTTNNTTTTSYTYVPLSTSKAIYFKAYVTGVDSTITNVYGAELFGVFKNNAGTITQVSTTDKVEKTLFSTATSDIDTDGTNIRVRVTGETAKTIDWQVRVEYNV